MYGENGGHLRDALAALLRQDRIQPRFQEPEELRQLIARYRHSVLVYCRIAVSVATPTTNVVATSGPSRGPVEELRYRLDSAIAASSAGFPTLEELATPQKLDLVEPWRRAAQASALGEHDFPRGLSWVSMTGDQSRTVLKDAAEITQSLVVLDERYTRTPGWEALLESRSLGRAAAVCAVFAEYDGQDLTVDLRGRRPALEPLDGPDPGGLSGVLQTEQNLLVHLAKVPDAHSLRLVIDSQRVLSNDLSKRTRRKFPLLSEQWQRRSETYTKLAQECRNVGGLVGDGRAAADGSVLLSRLRKAPTTKPMAAAQAKSFALLFDRIDTRLAAAINHGANERIYFLRAKVPRVDGTTTGMVHQVRERYAPIHWGADVLRVAREELRPTQDAPAPPTGARKSRQKLRDALAYQPADRGNAPQI